MGDFVSRNVVKRIWKSVVSPNEKAKYEEFFGFPHFFVRVAEASQGKAVFYSGFEKQYSLDTLCEVILTTDDANVYIAKAFRLFFEKPENFNLPKVKSNCYYEKVTKLDPVHDYNSFNKATKDVTKHNKPINKMRKKTRNIYDHESGSRSPIPSNAKTISKVRVPGKENLLLDAALKIYKEGRYKFLAFDFEVFEQNHNYVTEAGWSFYDPSNAESPITTSHYIVEEHYELRNGKYVPDRKNAFNFGKSKIMPLDKVIEELIKVLRKTDVLVGHGITSDFGYMQKKMNMMVQTVTPTTVEISHHPPTTKNDTNDDEPEYRHKGERNSWTTTGPNASAWGTDELLEQVSLQDIEKELGEDVAENCNGSEEKLTLDPVTTAGEKGPAETSGSPILSSAVSNVYFGGKDYWFSLDVGDQKTFCKQFHFFDTNELLPEQSNLEKSLVKLDVPSDEILYHNAGNDAYATMVLFQAICRQGN